MQHDCEAAQCRLTSSRAVRQEREDTDVLQTAIAHNMTRRQFVLNTHALHNATLIRRHLPRVLFKPESLYQDREKRHHELASSLRVTQVAKRAETQRKRKETREKNAQKKAGAALPGSSAAAPVQVMSGPVGLVGTHLIFTTAMLLLEFTDIWYLTAGPEHAAGGSTSQSATGTGGAQGGEPESSGRDGGDHRSMDVDALPFSVVPGGEVQGTLEGMHGSNDEIGRTSSGTSAGKRRRVE